MSEVKISNPPLFDRLRIQSLLRSIADQRGEEEMWNLLESAVRTELRWRIKYQHEAPRLRPEKATRS